MQAQRKNSAGKAQLTLETIAAVSVLLLLLALVVVINSNRDLMTTELGTAYSNSNECNGIALALSLLYSEGPYSKAEFTTGPDSNVGAGYVLLEGTRCDFIGRAVPAALNKGIIDANNTDGVIRLGNK
ncbi:MAG: hypothetical protein NT067_06095 [Candidatus Diapherotrites archaeon]|nr:hypothetical protein [Candidatus Diapherotrites archaeon]